MTEENLTKLLCTAGSSGDFQDAHDHPSPVSTSSFCQLPFSLSCSNFTVSFGKSKQVDWVSNAVGLSFILLSHSQNLGQMPSFPLSFIAILSMLEKRWYSVTFVYFTQYKKSLWIAKEGVGSLRLFCASSRGPSLHLPLISCDWINSYREMCQKVWCVAFALGPTCLFLTCSWSWFNRDMSWVGSQYTT